MTITCKCGKTEWRRFGCAPKTQWIHEHQKGLYMAIPAGGYAPCCGTHLLEGGCTEENESPWGDQVSRWEVLAGQHLEHLHALESGYQELQRLAKDAWQAVYNFRALMESSEFLRLDAHPEEADHAS